MKPDQQQVKNLLLDTVTLLCKNSLEYNNELRVEGLLGVAVDDSEVFFLHISENFVNMHKEQQPHKASGSCVSGNPEETANKTSNGSLATKDKIERDLPDDQTCQSLTQIPVDSVKLKIEPIDSDDDLQIIPSPELRPPDAVAQPASRRAGQRRPLLNPHRKSPSKAALLMDTRVHPTNYTNTSDISLYPDRFEHTADQRQNAQYDLQHRDSGEPQEKRRTMMVNKQSPDTNDQTGTLALESAEGSYLGGMVGMMDTQVQRDKDYQESEWTHLPQGDSTVNLSTVKMELTDDGTFYETSNQDVTDPGCSSWQGGNSEGAEREGFIVKILQPQIGSQDHADHVTRQKEACCTYWRSLRDDERRRRVGGLARHREASTRRYHMKKGSLETHRQAEKKEESAGSSSYGLGVGRHRCKFCGKFFRTSSRLTIHVRSHTGEKPFSCETCGARFSQSSHLGQHVVIHTGVKPYRCFLCQKSFYRRSYLTRHFTLQHSTMGYP